MNCPTALPVRAAGSVATSSSSPSPARAGACVRRATPGAWPRPPPVSPIASWRKRRCASGYCRCPSACATSWRTIRLSRPRRFKSLAWAAAMPLNLLRRVACTETSFVRCCGPSAAARCAPSPSSPSRRAFAKSSNISMSRARPRPCAGPRSAVVGDVRCRAGAVRSSSPAGAGARIRPAHRLAGAKTKQAASPMVPICHRATRAWASRAGNGVRSA